MVNKSVLVTVGLVLLGIFGIMGIFYLYARSLEEKSIEKAVKQMNSQLPQELEWGRLEKVSYDDRTLILHITQPGDPNTLEPHLRKHYAAMLDAFLYAAYKKEDRSFSEMFEKDFSILYRIKTVSGRTFKYPISKKDLDGFIERFQKDSIAIADRILSFNVATTKLQLPKKNGGDVLVEVSYADKELITVTEVAQEDADAIDIILAATDETRDELAKMLLEAAWPVERVMLLVSANANLELRFQSTKEGKSASVYLPCEMLRQWLEEYSPSLSKLALEGSI